MSLAALERELAALVPKGAVFAVADPRAAPLGLHPEEEDAIVRAVPKRRAEFAAGRRAARNAMDLLGAAPAPIVSGSDRAPIWPQGLSGSISHTDTLCAAVLSSTTAFQSIGLDIERDAPLAEEIIETITLSSERSAFARTDYPRVFSAKEAVYKALYPLTKTVLEFHDLEVKRTRLGLKARLSRAAGSFRAGSDFYVKSGQVAGHVIHMTFVAQSIAD